MTRDTPMNQEDIVKYLNRPYRPTLYATNRDRARFVIVVAQAAEKANLIEKAMEWLELWKPNEAAGLRAAMLRPREVFSRMTSDEELFARRHASLPRAAEIALSGWRVDWLKSRNASQEELAAEWERFLEFVKERDAAMLRMDSSDAHAA